MTSPFTVSPLRQEDNHLFLPLLQLVPLHFASPKVTDCYSEEFPCKLSDCLLFFPLMFLVMAYTVTRFCSSVRILENEFPVNFFGFNFLLVVYKLQGFLICRSQLRWRRYHPVYVGLSLKEVMLSSFHVFTHRLHSVRNKEFISSLLSLSNGMRLNGRQYFSCQLRVGTGIYCFTPLNCP